MIEVEVLLVAVIVVLLCVILFSSGGAVKRRQLLGEIRGLREERRRLIEANEALRSSFGVGAEEQAKRLGDVLELVRDLESLRCMIEGGLSVRQKELTQRYGVPLGPELLERIIAARPSIDPTAKWMLAHELLVGEVGRALMKSLSAGDPLEKAAGDIGVPVVIARRQITRLQTFGYLDSSLKPTEFGMKAIA